MAIAEPARHRLHDGLKEAIGDENTGTLMAMLPPYPWDEIAKRSDVEELRVSLDGKLEATNAKIDALDVKFEGKFDAFDIKFGGKIDALDGKIDALDVKFGGKFDALDMKFGGKFEALDIKIDSLDVKSGGKFDALEGKIDSLFAKIVLANVGMTISICGLLLAAIKLGV